MRAGHIVGPVILVILGVLFLLNNLGWQMPLGYLIRTFWPLTLVALGLSHLVGGFTHPRRLTGNVIGAATLIAVGVLLQLNNLEWHLSLGYFFRTFWPVILVVLGVVHVAGALVGHGSLAGGVVLLTLGVLFSLQQMFGVRFGDTWPILLIAIGAAGLIRAVMGPAAFGNRFGGGVHR